MTSFSRVETAKCGAREQCCQLWQHAKRILPGISGAAGELSPVKILCDKGIPGRVWSPKRTVVVCKCVKNAPLFHIFLHLGRQNHRKIDPWLRGGRCELSKSVWIRRQMIFFSPLPERKSITVVIPARLLHLSNSFTPSEMLRDWVITSSYEVMIPSILASTSTLLPWWVSPR